jgi:UDP-glucose 4-epimerase
MKKNVIIVTGGTGFVGSNLIERLSKLRKYKIYSLDNYSAGCTKNHIKNKNVKYLRGSTENFDRYFKKISHRINTVFHFGEFSRIYQSFKYLEDCFNSNVIGSNRVFNFCNKNEIKLIYSATSASLGNKGKDENLSPYFYTKAKNLETLENFKKWFNFKFEIIYFYIVYGKNHIKEGDMATIIGIFEKQYEKKTPLTVVKPGSQTRRFTHINDTIDICIEAWKKNECKHYAAVSSESYSILQIARKFNDKIKFLPERKREKYASVLTKMNLSNKVILRKGKRNISDYISEFKKNLKDEQKNQS